jgi:excisionase family DNA binding protein
MSDRRRRNPKPTNILVYFSVAEVARRTGFHPNTIRSWARDGLLRSFRAGVGGKLYFAEPDLAKFLRREYGIEVGD